MRARHPAVDGLPGRQTSAQRLGLAHSQFGQWHVDVARGNVDHAQTGGLGRIACDVASTLAVTDDPHDCGHFCSGWLGFMAV